MLIIYGATGSLAKERIIPAIRGLGMRRIICLGRRAENKKHFLRMQDAYNIPDLYYERHGVGEGTIFNVVQTMREIERNASHSREDRKEGKKEDKVFILVELFNSETNLLEALIEHDIQRMNKAGFKKPILLIDKPIGKCYESCKKIIDMLLEARERGALEFYFIDHYMYKQEMNNGRSGKKGKKLRLATGDSLHFIFSDTSSLEGRHNFFDKTGGIINDMLQSHALCTIDKLVEIDLHISNLNSFSVDNAIYALSKNPVSVKCSFCYCNPITRQRNKIYFDIGKYRKENKRCIKICASSHNNIREEKKVISFDSNKCAYKTLLEDIILKGDYSNTIKANVILNNWKIADKLSKFT